MHFPSRSHLLWAFALLISPRVVDAAMTHLESSGEPAYVVRGRQVEALQRTFHDRLDRLHRSLTVAIGRAAPDLLASFEAPPPSEYGYQILPKIGTDAAPPPPGTKSQVVSFSWSWSETLIGREMAAIDLLEADVANLSSSKPSPRDRAAYEGLVAEYKRALARRRTIDSDIDYNWLWQERIARDRPLYDRLQRTQQKVLERETLENALASGDDDRLRAAAAAAGLDATAASATLRAAIAERVQSLTRDITAATGRAAPRDFVSIEQVAPRQWVVTLPIYTDITDADFVEGLRRGVEDAWHVSRPGPNGIDDFRLRLMIETISPERLYCGDGDHSAADSSEPCTPPARGAHLALETHAARFPPQGAVLTTGATTLRWIGDRGIALGPYDVSPRVLAHEVGHTLGFPDAYFRGYRDAGADGFKVTELGDLGDIMGAPAVGPVLPRHFEILIAAKAGAFLNQSLQLYQQQRFTQSMVAARLALSLKPDYAEAYNNIAAAYAGLAMWDDAILAANEAIRLKPDFHLAKNNLAWAESERAKAHSR